MAQLELERDSLKLKLNGALEEVSILRELSKNKDIEVESLQKKVESLIGFSPSRRRNLINKPPVNKLVRRSSNEKVPTKPYVSRFLSPASNQPSFAAIVETTEEDFSSISKFDTFQREEQIDLRN